MRELAEAAVAREGEAGGAMAEFEVVRAEHEQSGKALPFFKNPEADAGPWSIGPARSLLEFLAAVFAVGSRRKSDRPERARLRASAGSRNQYRNVLLGGNQDLAGRRPSSHPSTCSTIFEPFISTSTTPWNSRQVCRNPWTFSRQWRPVREVFMVRSVVR